MSVKLTITDDEIYNSFLKYVARIYREYEIEYDDMNETKELYIKDIDTRIMFFQDGTVDINYGGHLIELPNINAFSNNYLGLLASIRDK